MEEDEIEDDKEEKEGKEQHVVKKDPINIGLTKYPFSLKRTYNSQSRERMRRRIRRGRTKRWLGTWNR